MGLGNRKENSDSDRDGANILHMSKVCHKWKGNYIFSFPTNKTPLGKIRWILRHYVSMFSTWNPVNGLKSEKLFSHYHISEVYVKMRFVIIWLLSISRFYGHINRPTLQFVCIHINLQSWHKLIIILCFFAELMASHLSKFTHDTLLTNKTGV